MDEGILIIDEDAMARRAAESLLRADGYRVFSEESTDNGLNVINNNQIIVVLSSITAPPAGALEFIEIINKKYKSVPVIITTGSLTIDMSIEALNKGAFAYIRKPLDGEELKAILNKAIQWTKLIEENFKLKELNKNFQKNVDSIIEEKTSNLGNANLKLIIKTRKLELMHQELKKANISTVKALAKAIEAKDSFTIGHSTRVQEYATIIAKHLDFSKSLLETLEYGAYLHDIGKIGVNEAILVKPGKLTEKEFEEVKLHTIIGETILKDIEFFEKLLPMVRSHHEEFNGTGYPDGLKEEKIPLMARILRVADVFDAVTSNRSYRMSMPVEQAMKILKKGKGTLFDPDIVDVFIKNYSE